MARGERSSARAAHVQPTIRRLERGRPADHLEETGATLAQTTRSRRSAGAILIGNPTAATLRSSIHRRNHRSRDRRYTPIALRTGPPLSDATYSYAYAMILRTLGVLESIWGATFGKAFCGLAVIGANRHGAPATIAVMIRAAVYTILPEVDLVRVHTGAFGSKHAGRPADILYCPGVRMAAGRDRVLDRATSQRLRRPPRSRSAAHARGRAASETFGLR